MLTKEIFHKVYAILKKEGRVALTKKKTGLICFGADNSTVTTLEKVVPSDYTVSFFAQQTNQYTGEVKDSCIVVHPVVQSKTEDELFDALVSS